MTTSAKPTILIAHGAWHIPAHYDKLQRVLEDAGYTVVLPHLPTCSKTLPIKATFADDCATINAAATALANKGTYFIMLMHSYGGVVGTNSLKGLSALQRRTAGMKGGAIRLIYMCAFLLPLNASLTTAFGGKLPDVMTEQKEQGTCTMVDSATTFYDEVKDPDEKARLVGLLTWHPTSAQHESRLEYKAYSDIPTTYLVCENDRGLILEVQWAMIKAAEGDVVKHGDGDHALETGGVLGGKVDVVTCQGGHSPFVSMPREVLNCVDSAVKLWEDWVN